MLATRRPRTSSAVTRAWRRGYFTQGARVDADMVVYPTSPHQLLTAYQLHQSPTQLYVSSDSPVTSHRSSSKSSPAGRPKPSPLLMERHRRQSDSGSKSPDTHRPVTSQRKPNGPSSAAEIAYSRSSMNKTLNSPNKSGSHNRSKTPYESRSRTPLRSSYDSSRTDPDTTPDAPVTSPREEDPDRSRFRTPVHGSSLSSLHGSYVPLCGSQSPIHRPRTPYKTTPRTTSRTSFRASSRMGVHKHSPPASTVHPALSLNEGYAGNPQSQDAPQPNQKPKHSKSRMKTQSTRKNSHGNNPMNGDSRDRTTDNQDPTKDIKVNGQQRKSSLDTEFWSRAECASRVQDILDEFSGHHTGIQEQYGQFLKTFPEFLTALKLVKPGNLRSFRTLQDVEDCHSFLRQSPSVRKNIRSDLIAQYLEFIRCIWSKVTWCAEKISSAKPHVLKYVLITDFLTSVHSIRSLLSLDFNFNCLPVVSDPDLSSILDRKLFSGLVSYFPALIQAESDVIGSLNKLIMELKFQDAEDITDREISADSAIVSDVTDQRRASEALTEKAIDAYCDGLGGISIEGEYKSPKSTD